MKTAFFILLVAMCYVDCRKLVQLDKTANTAFINMEAGGPPKQPAKLAPAPAPTPAKPAPTPAKPLDKSQLTHNAPVSPAKPVTGTAQPVQQPKVEPLKPGVSPPLPAGPASPASTPGPGSVKSLVNFYDSQGKHSVIRPYSYAQAVKQGKQ